MRRRPDPDQDLVVAHARRLADLDDAGDDDLPAAALDPQPSRWLPRARLDPGRRGAVAFGAVAAVSAGVAALLTWWSRPTVEPVTAPSATVSVPTAVSTVAAPSSTAPSSAATVVVSVVGKVRKPGLVTLPAGARVADAIAAAGGAVPGTDLTTVNLAARVADGEQVAVGVPGAAVVTGSTGGAGAGGGGSVGGAGTPVNLNTADAAALEALPGIGPVLAQRIVDYRTAHGPFASVQDLSDVSGVGPSVMEQLQDLVTV